MKRIVTLLAATAIFLSCTQTVPSQEMPWTFFGKTAQEIEDAGTFGRKEFDRPKQGKFNVTDSHLFFERIRNLNPYASEVGFEGGRSVYFLIEKTALEPSRQINDAEANSLLYRCVSNGGAWKKQTAAATGDDAPAPPTVYEYTRNEGGAVAERLFAFRTHDRFRLFVYHPFVAPNLGNLHAVTKLAYVFDGGRIEITHGGPNAGEEEIKKPIKAPKDFDLHSRKMKPSERRKFYQELLSGLRDSDRHQKDEGGR